MSRLTVPPSLHQSSADTGDKQFFFDQGIIDAGKKRLKQQQQEGQQTGEVCLCVQLKLVRWLSVCCVPFHAFSQFSVESC